MSDLSKYGPDALCWCGKSRKKHHTASDFCYAADGDVDKFTPYGLFECTGCEDLFEKDQLEYVACEGLFCRICMDRIINAMQGDDS